MPIGADYVIAACLSRPALYDFIPKYERRVHGDSSSTTYVVQFINPYQVKIRLSQQLSSSRTVR